MSARAATMRNACFSECTWEYKGSDFGFTRGRTDAGCDVITPWWLDLGVRLLDMVRRLAMSKREGSHAKVQLYPTMVNKPNHVQEGGVAHQGVVTSQV